MARHHVIHIWEPHKGQMSDPTYFSQSNLIKANVKVINFGRLLLRVIDEHKVTPRYIFDQLSLENPVMPCEVFLTSCRTRLGLSKKIFSDKDLRDTFALMNREKSTVNVGEFHSFLLLIQRLDEPRRSNTVSQLASSKSPSSSLSSLYLGSSISSDGSTPRKTKESKVIHLDNNSTEVIEPFKLDFQYTLNGYQLFTVPYHGTWRILARGAYGGNVAMEEGGKPVECCATIDCLEPGQTFVIGVGEGGHMGGGGGATVIALLDKGDSITDLDKQALLLMIVGGGGGAGFCDGIEATCQKRGTKGLHKESEDPEVTEKGGKDGKGLNSKTLKDGTKVVSVRSLLAFASKMRYGGLFGGGDAADAFSLTGPKTGEVLSPMDFTFLAGGGGGGGYRGGEGGTLGGGGGASYVDRTRIKEVDFFRVVTSERDEGINYAANGYVELSISRRIYKKNNQALFD